MRSRRPMIIIEVIHTDVTDLHGLLSPVVLAIDSVVDHLHSWPLYWQTCWEKTIWKTCHVNHPNHITPHPRWKKFNKSDTSWCQRIPWSSRACCPHRPQCWRTSTCMSLMLSYMFQELTKNLSCRTPSQQHITSYVVEKFWLKWYLLMSATSLVFSSMLSSPFTVSSTTNSHIFNVVRHVARRRKKRWQLKPLVHITS